MTIEKNRKYIVFLVTGLFIEASDKPSIIGSILGKNSINKLHELEREEE